MLRGFVITILVLVVMFAFGHYILQGHALPGLPETGAQNPGTACSAYLATGAPCSDPWADGQKVAQGYADGTIPMKNILAAFAWIVGSLLVFAWLITTTSKLRRKLREDALPKQEQEHWNYPAYHPEGVKKTPPTMKQKYQQQRMTKEIVDE